MEWNLLILSKGLLFLDLDREVAFKNEAWISTFLSSVLKTLVIIFWRIQYVSTISHFIKQIFSKSHHVPLVVLQVLNVKTSCDEV